MRDPYDMLCGCARWIITMLEATENANRGYIRSSMDSSVHDGVDRGMHDSDDSDEEKSHHVSYSHKIKGVENDLGNELNSPYIVKSDLQNRDAVPSRHNDSNRSNEYRNGRVVGEKDKQLQENHE